MFVDGVLGDDSPHDAAYGQPVRGGRAAPGLQTDTDYRVENVTGLAAWAPRRRRSAANGPSRGIR